MGLETRFDNDLIGDCSSMFWSSEKLLTLGEQAVDVDADELRDDGGVLVKSPALTLKMYSSRVIGCSPRMGVVGRDSFRDDVDVDGVGNGLFSISTEVVRERVALAEIDCCCWDEEEDDDDGKMRCSNWSEV